MAWGQAKGLQLYSKFWDENFGCAYIPCELVKEQDLPALLEGSIIDESTLPGGITLPNCKNNTTSFYIVVAKKMRPPLFNHILLLTLC